MMRREEYGFTGSAIWEGDAGIAAGRRAHEPERPPGGLVDDCLNLAQVRRAEDLSRLLISLAAQRSSCPGVAVCRLVEVPECRREQAAEHRAAGAGQVLGDRSPVVDKHARCVFAHVARDTVRTLLDWPTGGGDDA